MRVLAAAPLVILGAALAQPIAAQTAGRGLGIAVAAGPTLNDFETGGTDWVFVAGAEWRPATGPFVVLADIRYSTYSLATREHLVMPESAVQIEATVGPVRPFIGAGLGFQYAARPGRRASSFSANLSAGLRVRISRSAGLRFEARGRSLDPFIGLTAGVVVRP